MKIASRLGIFGGTFSPVHNGHVGAAKAFIKSGMIDKLLIIPTLIPPHKQQIHTISAEHRFNMLKLAFEELRAEADVEISDYELQKDTVSYTVETLLHYRPYCDEIKLLCGSDMFLSIDTWYHADELFQLCEIVYEKRNGSIEESERLTEKSEQLFCQYGVKSTPLPLEQIINISSSQIREKLIHGKDVSAYIDAKVLNYIKGHHLYAQL
ncbi:MAG: nicotinate (nicotinamide) nucleotide adenylyltransferase [Clostridiales bacterium]|nr:nicotinate (nicotinamide) nucleotide adenylyltransferase [Clostridiales bacterium]